MRNPCFGFAVIALALWPCATHADAPSTSPLAVTAPANLAVQRDAAEQASLALPPGLSLKDVHVTRTEVTWEVDAKGHVKDIRFTHTGSGDVDSAIPASVARRSLIPDTGAARPVSAEYAHVYLFPNAMPLPPPPGPMIPMAGSVAPPAEAPPAPAGNRAFPVLASDPSHSFTNPTSSDFPGQEWPDVAGKTFQVSWRVDETGMVTDVVVTPGDASAVADGLIRHFFSLCYWPCVQKGKPITSQFTHTYQF